MPLMSSSCSFGVPRRQLATSPILWHLSDEAPKYDLSRELPRESDFWLPKWSLLQWIFRRRRNAVDHFRGRKHGLALILHQTSRIYRQMDRNICLHLEHHNVPFFQNCKIIFIKSNLCYRKAELVAHFLPKRDYLQLHGETKGWY